MRYGAPQSFSLTGASTTLFLSVTQVLRVTGPFLRGRVVRRKIGPRRPSAAVTELGADLHDLDEVVTDVAVEADELPLPAGAVAGDPGEARRLPLGIFRARAHQHPIGAAVIQLCDLGHGIRCLRSSRSPRCAI